MSGSMPALMKATPHASPTDINVPFLFRTFSTAASAFMTSPNGALNFSRSSSVNFFIRPSPSPYVAQPAFRNIPQFLLLLGLLLNLLHELLALLSPFLELGKIY